MTIPADDPRYPFPACSVCGEANELCDQTGCNGQFNPGFRTRSQMSDREMLHAILENQVWLTGQVAEVMGRFQSNPMFKMMMGRNK